MVARGEVPSTAAAARNPSIDLLRGVSILFVVLNHVGLRIPLRKTPAALLFPRWFLQALNFNGYEAVLVFFVISGFLITLHALERSGALSAISFRAFYARRFSRIVPCLLLLVAVLSVLHLLAVQDYVIRKPGQSLGGAIASALGLHLNWYEGHTGYLPGGWDILWSLSIEEVFYLAFPILCAVTRREWVLGAGLLALALSLPITHAAAAGNEIWQEKAYLPGMAAIATGVVAAIAIHRARALRRGVLIGAFAVGTVGIVLVLFDERALWSVWRDGALLVLTFSTALWIASSHALKLRAVPGLGWLRSCGRLTYEIYLSHMFVVFAVVRLFRASGASMAWGLFAYVPALALSWALGKAVATWFSLPLERRLRARLLDRPREELRAATPEVG